MPSHWDNDPEHPVEDWRYEVANDDTRLGYQEWIAHRKADAGEDKPAACARCTSDLDGLGYCVEETCPFDRVQQDNPMGWAGHPDPPQGVRAALERLEREGRIG